MANFRSMWLTSIQLNGVTLSMGPPFLVLTSKLQLKFEVRPAEGVSRLVDFVLKPTDIQSLSFSLKGDRMYISVTVLSTAKVVVDLKEKVLGLDQLPTDAQSAVEFEFTLANPFVGDKNGLLTILVRMASNAKRANPAGLANRRKMVAKSQLDHNSIEYPIATELWTKILSYLPIPDRIEAELVGKQFQKASKSTWSQAKATNLHIDEETFDSPMKVATLLRRCGRDLEEISTQQHIRLDCESEEQLGQLCPRLKFLSFECGSSLSIGGCKADSFRSGVDRLLMSLSQLERLEFFCEINTWECEGNLVLQLQDFVGSLTKVPSLLELHLLLEEPNELALAPLGRLAQLKVFSVTVPAGNFLVAIEGICRLEQLEELYIRVNKPDAQLFTPAIVARLATSLKRLWSLVVVVDGTRMDVGLLASLIEQLTQLRTLVVVMNGPFNFLGTTDLSAYDNRTVPLRIFTAVSNPTLPIFGGDSARVEIVPMPNSRYGEAVEFLSTCSQNGFDFNAHKCLQMMLRSKDAKGRWDFFTKLRWFHSVIQNDNDSDSGDSDA